MFSVFWLTITLTEKGVANWIFVVKQVYDYIFMNKENKPQKWIFDELKLIASAQFGTLINFMIIKNRFMLQYFNLILYFYINMQRLRM